MIKIYGFGDSLIVVEGDINQDFSVLEKSQQYLTLSNGMLLRFKFVDGIWKIKIIADNDVEETNFHIENAEEQEDITSDVITIDEFIEWIVFGELARI